MPSISRTRAFVTWVSSSERHWSSSESASRMPPSLALRDLQQRLFLGRRALLLQHAFQQARHVVRGDAAELELLAAGKHRGGQLVRLGRGKMNTTCAGGSSSVFSSALNALVESICTSSTIYTLNLPTAGMYFTFSIISRTRSTLLLLAASISMMSIFASPKAQCRAGTPRRPRRGCCFRS